MPSDIGSDGDAQRTSVGGNGGVDRVTAHFENVHAGRGGQGLAGGDDSELGLDHGAGLPTAGAGRAIFLGEQRRERG